jgi:glycosyltransferase 2 family protein
MSPGKIARFAVALATVATTVALAVRLDERRVIASFANVSWGWVVATAVVNVANTVIEAWRWTLIASALDRNLRVRSAFLAMVAGVAGGLVLPFKLGEGVRAYVFAKAERLAATHAVGTVVADRLTDLMAFALVAVGTSMFIPLPGRIGVSIHAVAGGLAGALVLTVLLTAVRPIRVWLQADGRPPLSVRLGRWLDTLARFGRSVPVPRVAVAALASWLTRAVVVWGMMRAFNLPLPPAAALVALVVINVGIAVTGVPGNVGSFELATVGALGLYSIPPETAVSFGIALHATELLPLLAIGAVLALAGTIDVAGLAGAASARPGRD